MLNWSNSGYKLTVGVGSLVVAGLLSTLFDKVLPAWAVVLIALVPLVLFVFFRPGEMPDLVVQAAHIFAAVWYLVVVVGLLVMLAENRPLPRGWPVYPLFAAVGAIPCVLTLYRAACGDNRVSATERFDPSVVPQPRPASVPSFGRARLECYPSMVKLLGLLSLTCVMVGASYFCTTLPESTPRVFGWIGIGFFGLGFIAFPVMFFRTGPQVIINDEGIEDRRLKAGVIRWADVRAVSIGSVNSAKFLCIEVADPEAYLARLPRWKRSLAAANSALGFPALTISFSGLRPGLKEVWADLQARPSLRIGARPA